MLTPIERQLAPADGWITPGRVRLGPLTASEASLGQRLFSNFAVKVGKVNAPNLFLTLLRNPRLFRHWLMFAKQMMPYGQLDRRDTELVILRVGWNCRSRYEWGQHVDIGLRVGVAPEEISRVAQGPESKGWDERTAAMLRACDEIHDHKIISESTWQTLASAFDEKRLLELLMLINHYEMLAGVLNSIGLELDSSLEKVLASAPIHGASGATGIS